MRIHLENDKNLPAVKSPDLAFAHSNNFHG